MVEYVTITTLQPALLTRGALQEADIQELRKRLIKQGRFTEEFLGADALHALEDADGSVSPVLMEVLQIQARISVPDAARRRVWELYVPPSKPVTSCCISVHPSFCVCPAGDGRQDCPLCQNMNLRKQSVS